MSRLRPHSSSSFPKDGHPETSRAILRWSSVRANTHHSRWRIDWPARWGMVSGQKSVWVMGV
jgi:hypothetical protein